MNSTDYILDCVLVLTILVVCFIIVTWEAAVEVIKKRKWWRR